VKILKRQCVADDLHFEAVGAPDPAKDVRWTSRLTLLCVHGWQYTGQPCFTKKEADLSAAFEAVADISPLMHILVPPVIANATPKTAVVKRIGVGVTGLTAEGKLLIKSDNPKGRLMEIIAKTQKVALDKGDVVYTLVTPEGAGTDPKYQCQVTLACLPGQPQFSGQEATTKKGAEQSAAQQAIDSFGKQLSDLQITYLGPEEETKHKSMLNALVQRYLEKPVTKDDFEWVYESTEEGFVASVKIPCLNREFSGKAQQNKKLASHAAAGEAVAYLETLDLPPPLTKALLPLAGAGDGSSISSAKGDLYQAVTQLAGRPLDKGDISYQEEECSSGYLSTVLVKGYDNLTSKGSPRSRKRDAQHSAAAKSLAVAQKLLPAPLESRSNPKGLVLQWLAKVAKKPIGKEDFIYEIVTVEQGYQAELVLKCLGEDQRYRGVPEKTKKLAERSAAQIALDYLQGQGR